MGAKENKRNVQHTTQLREKKVRSREKKNILRRAANEVKERTTRDTQEQEKFVELKDGRDLNETPLGVRRRS